MARRLGLLSHEPEMQGQCGRNPYPVWPKTLPDAPEIPARSRRYPYPIFPKFLRRLAQNHTESAGARHSLCSQSVPQVPEMPKRFSPECRPELAEIRASARRNAYAIWPKSLLNLPDVVTKCARKLIRCARTTVIWQDNGTQDRSQIALCISPRTSEGSRRLPVAVHAENHNRADANQKENCQPTTTIMEPTTRTNATAATATTR